jgi:hypothetical protein
MPYTCAYFPPYGHEHFHFKIFSYYHGFFNSSTYNLLKETEMDFHAIVPEIKHFRVEEKLSYILNFYQFIYP